MRNFFHPAEGPYWLRQTLSSIRSALGDVWDRPIRVAHYTVAALPDASAFSGGIIYISDEAGGAIPAFSDGTNWREASRATAPA